MTQQELKALLISKGVKEEDIFLNQIPIITYSIYDENIHSITIISNPNPCITIKLYRSTNIDSAYIEIHLGKHKKTSLKVFRGGNDYWECSKTNFQHGQLSPILQLYKAFKFAGGHER